jgi:hypothetical protein
LVLLAWPPLAVAAATGDRIARNEADTIEFLRQLTRAQAAYQSVNDGFYDQLRCLATPAACLPRYQGPALLDPALASLPARHGYRFRFHPGPPAGALAVQDSSSASSLLGYAVTAVPLREGVTGRRWFCIDESGVVREPDHAPLVAREGGCAREARTLVAPPPASPDEGERRTIADLRVIVSAQQAYASLNGGFFDRLDCLAEPARCLPGAPKDTPAFLDPQLASLNERHGYRRRFHPGPPPPGDQGRYVSATSMIEYAYTAVPTLPGRTGHRAFCADSRGVICQTTNGRPPRVLGALCVPCTEVP